MSLGVPHVPIFYPAEKFDYFSDVEDVDDFGVKYKWDDFLEKDDEGDDFLENEEWDDFLENDEGDDLAEKDKGDDLAEKDEGENFATKYKWDDFDFLEKDSENDEGDDFLEKDSENDEGDDFLEKDSENDEAFRFNVSNFDDDDDDFKDVRLDDDIDFKAFTSRLFEDEHWGSDFYANKAKRRERREEEEWVELPTLFFDAGILVIFGIIDEEAANNLISAILLLRNDMENIDHLTFYLNSPGGFLKPGLAIFDIMQSSDLDLGFHTIGLGLVASTASLLLSGGDLGCRQAFPHTRVMLHQPCGKYTPPQRPESYPGGKRGKKKPTLPDLPDGGQVEEFIVFANELLDVRQKVIDVFAVTTKQDPDVISRDIERDFFLSAEEAKAYGIIDHVIGDA